MPKEEVSQPPPKEGKKALAGATVELLGSPTLVSRAKADFAKWRGDRPYTSLIPRQQRAPEKIR